MSHVYADADHPTYGRIQRRIDADRAFLATLRRLVEAGNRDELAAMARNHRSKNAPAWKRIAIKRALAKVDEAHATVRSVIDAWQPVKAFTYPMQRLDAMFREEP